MLNKTTLDLAMVRGQFPAFCEPDLSDQVFFENAGGSYACAPVIERLERYYRRTKVQPYYPSAASVEAGRRMDESYQRLAPWLGVTPDWLHFGPSTTQNAYVLAQGARAFLSPGDNVIVTEQEHEANSGAWRRLADVDVEVRQWGVQRDSGQLDLADLDALINERTAIVAFTHCSNVLGHINPVREICQRAKSVGAISVVDGVSFAAHGFPDVVELDADIYLFSLYKTFGPHQGLMVARPAVAARFANQSHFFNDDQPRKRLIPAGPDHAQVAAAQGIADYFDAVVAHHRADHGRSPAQTLRALFADAEQRRLARLLDGLATLPRVRLIGPAQPEGRAPTVSIVVDGYPSDELCADLAARKVMAGSGHFYAKRLLDALDIAAGGVLRLSFVHYTTDDDVDRALTALDQCLTRRRPT